MDIKSPEYIELVNYVIDNNPDIELPNFFINNGTEVNSKYVSKSGYVPTVGEVLVVIGNSKYMNLCNFDRIQNECDINEKFTFELYKKYKGIELK